MEMYSIATLICFSDNPAPISEKITPRNQIKFLTMTFRYRNAKHWSCAMLSASVELRLIGARFEIKLI